MLKESIPTCSASTPSSTALRMTWSPGIGWPFSSAVTAMNESSPSSYVRSDIVLRAPFHECGELPCWYNTTVVDNRESLYPGDAMTTIRDPVNGPTTPTELSTLLAGLGREATARVRRAIRPFGLGAQQYLVLSQLRDLGYTSQVDLAAALGLDPSNL